MQRKYFYGIILLVVVILTVVYFIPVRTQNTLNDNNTDVRSTYLVKRFKSNNYLFDFLLPSQSKLERGDVIVFYDPTVSDTPLKKRKKYVGRLIGLPGDAVQIDNREVIVNASTLSEWYPLYYKYRISFSEANSIAVDKISKHEGISDWEVIIDNKAYEFISTYDVAQELSEFEDVVNIRRLSLLENEEVNNYYPFASNIFWNRDFYGPIFIPQKGVTMMLTNRNIGIYEKVIDVFENHSIISNLSKIEIDGKIEDKYAFESDYFFVLNDNRDCGKDSRHFGFVPSENVIGKAIKK